MKLYRVLKTINDEITSAQYAKGDILQVEDEQRAKKALDRGLIEEAVIHTLKAEKADEVNVDEMKVDELRAYLDEHNIEYDAKALKAELIDLAKQVKA